MTFLLYVIFTRALHGIIVTSLSASVPKLPLQFVDMTSVRNVHLSNGESDRISFVGLIIHCISHIGLHLVVDATRLSCNI